MKKVLPTNSKRFPNDFFNGKKIVKSASERDRVSDTKQLYELTLNPYNLKEHPISSTPQHAKKISE